jgi:peroxiredoxin
MKQLFNYTAVFVSLLLMMSFVSFNKGPINDFSLKNIDGKFVSLSDYKEAKGFIIIFTCNHCPFAKLYPPRFNALNEKYKKLGVPLIAISSTDTIQYEEDTFVEMVKKAVTEKFNFPYLYDSEQQAAKNFNAQKTPHAFVIWKENNQWVVKYDGAIDDNGMKPEEVKTQFVANAVDALLANQKLTVTETKSIGCQIYYRNN